MVGDLERLVREHPYRERLRGQLMLALYRTGRQADALAAYQAARRTLVQELGIKPSVELRELEQRMLRHDPSLSRRQPRRDRSRRTISPIPATPFLGRARELSEVTTLLGDADRRLVTLTGAGGSGKTRLALRVAETCAAGIRERDVVCRLCRYHRSGADRPYDRPGARAHRAARSDPGAAA